MEEQEKINSFQQICDVMMLPFFRYRQQPNDTQRCVEGAYAKRYHSEPPRADLNMENPSLDFKLEFDPETCTSGRYSFAVCFPEETDAVKKAQQIVEINQFLENLSLDGQIDNDSVTVVGPFDRNLATLHAIVGSLQDVDAMVRAMYDKPE